MDADVAGRLQAILASDGTELASDPQSVAARLADLCPDRPLEVSLLVTACEQGTARALLDRTGTALEDQIAALSQDLAEARSLSRESAGWAVQAWAFALGTGARSPGPLARPGPPSGRRTRLLMAGAAAVALVVALGVLIPRLVGGAGEDDAADPSGPAAAQPSIASSAGSAGPPAPLVVLAHQGGWETYPLETLPALVAAAKAGAAVEIDVHWTSDAVPVLVHDDQTTPANEAGKEHPMVCKGGPYTVSQTRWEVLRSSCRTVASASEDGRSYPIPTFDEAIKAIAAVPGAQVVAEVKPEAPTAAQIGEYLATVTKYGMAQRTVVSSFYPDALARIRAQAEPDGLALRYLLMLRPSPEQDLPTAEQLSSQRLWGVALRSDIATRGNVAGLHAKKLIVVVWTLNTAQQWSAARQAAADLVLTDEPDAYRAWLPAP